MWEAVLAAVESPEGRKQRLAEEARRAALSPMARRIEDEAERLRLMRDRLTMCQRVLRGCHDGDL